MALWEKLTAANGRQGTSYWADRILAELTYAAKLSAVRRGRFDPLIEGTLDRLTEAIARDGVITDETARRAEGELLPLGEAAKSLTLLCVAHAHIDMNWMWGFHETAAVTIDTFRTMLDLMDEYPQFTFAQSQASVYRIVEQYAPWLLEDIRRRVLEGRWEVTASTWTEPDKNMPSGESLSRHILNTKRYLSSLLPVAPESLNIDFEPDTFGHSANVPEICAAGGVKYYYHCRGNRDHCIYRWQSPSGAELLVYREPDWYNSEIHPRMAEIVPEFCQRYDVDCLLKVYGVGDHGGGPTRRDLERLQDMATWPVMPEIRFGTFHEFFSRIDRPNPAYPVLQGEQNYIFMGCYTSQSRIKMANRIAEDRLYDAEALGAAARVLGGRDLSAAFTEAWEPVLFNHFHDILPGSGVIETREYALGGFQRSLAAANANAGYAMGRIAQRIDTASLSAQPDQRSTAEGGGVGFAFDEASAFRFTNASRASGKERAFTLFNTTAFARAEPVKVTVWDWPGDTARMTARTAEGQSAAVQVLSSGEHYWGHHYTDIVIDAQLPPLGYATYVIGEAPAVNIPFTPFAADRTDQTSDAPIVLENECIRAQFDRQTMKCVSLIEQGAGRELIDTPSCFFRLLEERTQAGSSAWTVGPVTRALDLNQNESVCVERVERGPLVQSVTYLLRFRASSLKVVVSLAAHACALSFQVEADFHELGTQTITPQLSFAAPFGYTAASFINDIPMGVIERGALPHDVPCRSFSLARAGEGGPSLMLMSDSKYGFRNGPRQLDLALIRGTSAPDPYPEEGVHHFRVGVAAVVESTREACAVLSAAFAHPCPAVNVRPHPGDLPTRASLCRINGENLCVSAIKTAEDGRGIVLRLYNAGIEAAVGRVSFHRAPREAWRCDTNERDGEVLSVESGEVTLMIAPQGIAAVRLVW
ncbi:MAG: alpha-mannosidase [Christensenellales bacterium]|jgi:alpha-mannosidase